MTRNKIRFILCSAVLFLISPAARAADSDRCSPQIADNAAAAGVCTSVCAKFGMVFAQNWSNDANHPPVKSCISAGAGQAVCGCMPTTPPVSDVIIEPTVQWVEGAMPPRIPVGLKRTCLQSPDSSIESDICPIVKANGLVFWALSYSDNRTGMAITAYDSDGNVVGLIERTGARYVWDIKVDGESQMLSFVGQGNQAITLQWTDLFVPQMENAETVNYVIWPTALTGQVSWTNGVQNYGTSAPFGTGTDQLLDPNVEHEAGKQLCAEKQRPWFDFVSATVTSPYSTVSCTQPPDPAQPTYNAAMYALLSAAIHDHSLMTALSAATTDDQLIAAAATKGYTITSADIAQSEGPPPTDQASREQAAAGAIGPSCGNVNQKPCSKCTKELCVYFPFNYCCIKETCACQKTNYTCASGLQIDSQGLCEPACPAKQICKDFEVFKEYNDNGTKANGVCEAWLYQSNCEKGIPQDAMAAYEVVFKNGLAYYKSTDTKVHTWTTTANAEMLYVIDGRDNKIYMVNVDGRYIQVRGSANCIPADVPQGGSTAPCSKPRLTTHAGILMGSIAGLPSQNTQIDPSAQRQIRVVGAGTIRVTDGLIQWITNDSGHFKPTVDNLKNSIAAIKSAGFPDFPPNGDCTYDFEPVEGKPGVYRQESITGVHCEL